MTREDLLKQIEALPPACRIIGLGPDSGGYDCTFSDDLQVVVDAPSSLAVIGVFESNEIRLRWLS